MCACIIQNQIILYVHQHLKGHYQVSGHGEYISFYELNLRLEEFKLYRIGLIHE